MSLVLRLGSREPASPADAAPELESLLAPIPGPRPAGESVRYAGDHDRIQEARRTDDPGLPQGVWQHEPKRADWATVEALASETLRERSKDLQVAAWFAEAQVQRRGFAGLAPGFRLLRGLCERFWDGMFPELEPEDPSGRLGPVAWLNDRLPVVIRELPLAEGPAERPYTWSDHERAQRLEAVRSRDPKVAERAEAGGAVTLAAIEAALAQIADAELRAILAAIDAGTAEIEALEALLDRLAGREAPGLVAVRAVLRSIGGLLATALRGRPGAILKAARRLVGAGSVLTPMPSPPLPTVVASDTAPGPVASREEAYRRLEEVAAFLARTEPHSPVALLLEHALAWGAMPLDQLILTLSHGRRATPALFELLGLAGHEDEDADEARELAVEDSTYG